MTWLVWGSTYLVIRFALVGFAPYFLMATRFAAAGGLLLLWQLARGTSMPNVREWRNAVLVGTLMLGGGMGGVAYAEQTIASGLVVVFIAVVPLLLVAINLAFGVHPQRSELLAVRRRCGPRVPFVG
jgi:drug/metabolite transporter (DMT)-like permease